MDPLSELDDLINEVSARGSSPPVVQESPRKGQWRDELDDLLENLENRKGVTPSKETTPPKAVASHVVSPPASITETGTLFHFTEDESKIAREINSLRADPQRYAK